MSTLMELNSWLLTYGLVAFCVWFVTLLLCIVGSADMFSVKGEPILNRILQDIAVILRWWGLSPIIVGVFWLPILIVVLVYRYFG